MTEQTTTDVQTEREQSVVAGVTAKPEPKARKRSTSRATKNADTSERRPTGAASMEAAERKPAKSEPSKTDLQKLVFAELFRRAGDIADSPPAGVSKQQAREILSQRMRYTPRAGELWDLRLGAKPSK